MHQKSSLKVMWKATTSENIRKRTNIISDTLLTIINL